MKLSSTLRFIIVAFCVVCGSNAFAQLPGWQYRMPVNLADTSGITQTNYQVKLNINTAALVASGHMQSTGDDIRFADSCGSIIYEHYVESGMNTANTIIWVRVPSIPANGTAIFYMFYGNSSAASTSSFALTFPAAFISSGPNVTLTGTQTYDWFQLNVNDTIFVQAGSMLTINARNTIINGVISGNGRGFQAPAVSTTGTGPGGGGTSSSAGSGGGSYGGMGGLGGLDAGDTPGNGGPVYGTANLTDIAMGSSGGSSGSNVGGNGGGAFTLNSDYVLISATGVIMMNGSTPSPNAQSGGGGGAGGGILILCLDLSHAGLLSCNGGSGSDGVSASNDGGGGGGGGRVKAFYTGNFTNLGGTSSATGGNGGLFGTQAPGQPGAAGSNSSMTGGGYDVPIESYGAEVNLTAAPSLALSSTTICSSDVVNATATPGYSTYAFLVNGTPVATGSSNTYTYTNLSNGDILSVSAVLPCYNIVSSTYTMTVNTNPTVALGSDTSVCGGSLMLDAGNAGSTYLWNDMSTNQTLIASSSGTYSVVATAGNGCTGSDAITVTVNTPPTVTASALDVICFDDATASLSGSPVGGTWTGPGVSGNNFDPMSAGQGSHVLTYTYTDINGCTASDTEAVFVDPCLGVMNTGTNIFGIAPNPNTGSFVIEFSFACEKATIEVVDVTGKVVQSKEVNSVAEGSHTTVNCNEQANGIYFVRITANGESTMQKMIIVK